MAAKPASKKYSDNIDLAPKTILGETLWRGDRVIHTDDRRLVGGDAAGFTIASGFVVRDEFDEPTLPNTMAWFWTPYDAFAAIEFRDTILPTIKEQEPNTTLVYEYNLMWSYRTHYHHVHHALHKIQGLLDDAKAFDGNPADDIQAVLHALRQQIASARGGAK